MAFDTLISAHALKQNIKTENWIVVDCRFDIQDSAWGEEEYRALHIPGAVYAHTDHDLSAPITPTSGRHPLPDPIKFCDTISRLGISNSTQVIAYDATSGSFASRLWFLLRYYGHKQVAVLDGGFSAWLQTGYATESGTIKKPRGTFTGSPNNEMIVTTPQIAGRLNDPNFLLIDARAQERFSGSEEPIDAKAGHIPGAVNRFYGLNSNPDGTFRPAAELRAEFQVLLQNHTPEQTAVYCGSGVTSAHHLLAMAVAGLPLPRLYAGSWSEWIRDPVHPIATGD